MSFVDNFVSDPLGTVEDYANKAIDFGTDVIGDSIDVFTLGQLSDADINRIKNIDTVGDLATTWLSGGLVTEYQDVEDAVTKVRDQLKGIFEQVFPSLDTEAITNLLELNIERMKMENTEQVRRLTAQFQDEMGYVRAVQASSGLSINSASFEADRNNRTGAFNAEISWMNTALEKNIEITTAEVFKEMSILDQQLTSQNINTGMGILDTILSFT